MPRTFFFLDAQQSCSAIIQSLQAGCSSHAHRGLAAESACCVQEVTTELNLDQVLAKRREEAIADGRMVDLSDDLDEAEVRCLSMSLA